jgi:hypothetical protein
MDASTTALAGGRSRVLATAWTVAVGLSGLCLAHHQMILSGFRLTPGDLGDARLVHYVLEHGYRWLARAPSHASFWNAPFHYPAANVAAYTDVLIAVGPPYWLARAAGLSMDASFQAWILAVSALNFVACFALLGWGLGLAAPGASIGAALFAFAGARITQASHPQLLPHFWSIVTLLAIALVFDERAAARSRTAWIWVAALDAALQVWSGLYHAISLALALIVAFAVSMAGPSGRAAVLRMAREHAGAIALASAVSAALIAPWAIHSFAASQEVGPRPYDEVATMIPRPWSWFYLGPHSIAHGWMSRLPLFDAGPGEAELRVGMGWLTTALGVAGLWFGRRRRATALIAWTAGVLVVATTSFFGLAPWKLVYLYLPGGGAIRAVGRVSLLVCLAVAVGVTIIVNAVASRRTWGLAAGCALGAAVLLEQVQRVPTFDSAVARQDVLTLARAVAPGCQAFLFTPVRGEDPPWKYQLDAMWAGIETGLPTVNGYCGNFPPEWNLYDANIWAPEDEWDVVYGLQRWSRASFLDVQTVCWIRQQLPRRL